MTPGEYVSRVGHAFRLSGPLAADPTAQKLNSMLWALTLWFGIWGIILLPFHYHDWFWSMQNQIATDAALITALLLLRHGHFRAASITYLSSIWFFGTHVMALNGGVRSHVQVLYVTLPISAAWLLGYHAAIWVSSVCMGCTLVFAVLELAGVMLPHRIPGTPLGAWAVFGMACLIGAVPVAQILRDLRSALKRSRQAEDESQQTTERLRIEIDEHKRTAHALAESEERFRIAANTAPVMILARDSEQNATFFNKVWLDFRGRSLEQELGRGWREGIHPNDLESYLAGQSFAYDQRKEYHLQFRLRRADGEYRLVLCHGVPSFALDGSLAGYFTSCIDITDLKRGQEEALGRQKWESLGVLAGGVAHDFNNLLGSIRAQSEALLQELRDPEAREGVSKIESIAVQASEIVRQLMIYAGQESATLEQVDLASVLRDMLPLVSVSASKNAALEVDLPAGLPMIRANVAQLRQVLLNLVTNASEALEGKVGIIRIKLAEARLPEGEQAVKPVAGHYLRVEISDTGCGMTEQIRAGIFDPFFTTKGAGRGLGLAAAQGIVHSHGGSISVQSSPGLGSRFEILLPCETEAEVASPTPAKAHPVDGNGNFTATVLMIEDEEPLRCAVAKLLRAKGLRVLEASNGSAAVDFCRTDSSNIDVALLDATLPQLSGREVLEQLRKILPPERVIVTSAYGKQQAFTTVHAEPCQPYIRKPYSVNELVELIRTACLKEQAARI